MTTEPLALTDADRAAIASAGKIAKVSKTTPSWRSHGAALLDERRPNSRTEMAALARRCRCSLRALYALAAGTQRYPSYLLALALVRELAIPFESWAVAESCTKGVPG
jgi:hypothetical protein